MGVFFLLSFLWRGGSGMGERFGGWWWARRKKRVINGKIER